MIDNIANNFLNKSNLTLEIEELSPSNFHTQEEDTSNEPIRPDPPYDTLPLTGNIYIDGILFGGNRWTLDSDRTIAYSFLRPRFELINDVAYPWLNYEIEAVEKAFEAWSNVADISFVRAADDDINATLGLFTGNDVNNEISGQAGEDLIYGLSGNDSLSGNTGNDTLDGGDGDDFISGNTGNDTLDGQAGNDTLIGEWGKDTLIGGNGDDFLVGNRGDDLLFGGSGSDRFVLNVPGEGIDNIPDFLSSEDQIVLSAEGFGGGLVEGVLATEQFYLGSAATVASHRLIYDSSTGELFFDVDGVDGMNQTQLATLSSRTNLDFSDIVITA